MSPGAQHSRYATGATEISLTPPNEIQMQLEHTVRRQQERMDLLLAAGQEEEALHEQQIQDLQQQHARKVEKMEEKGRRMIKELEEARLQLKTSQAEVTTLKEECAEAKKRVQELLHFKEELLFTRKTLNELEVLLATREEEAKRNDYEHMQEKEAFRQEMLALREDSIRREREEREEREALMAEQLHREEDIEALREELQEWRQKWEERRENSEITKEGRALTEVQRRLFRSPTSPLTQPHPPQPVPQPSPLLGMVEIEDPILQEVEPEVDEVAQVEERATWQVRNSSEEEDVDMFESMKP
eukprot:Em0146g4a